VARGKGKAIPAATLSGFTYRLPAHVSRGRPGEVIATSDLGPDSLVGSADRRVVVYHSTSVTGRDGHVTEVPQQGVF
jgi:hypothetical protein